MGRCQLLDLKVVGSLTPVLPPGPSLLSGPAWGDGGHLDKCPGEQLLLAPLPLRDPGYPGLPQPSLGQQMAPSSDALGSPAFLGVLGTSGLGSPVPQLHRLTTGGAAQSLGGRDLQAPEGPDRSASSWAATWLSRFAAPAAPRAQVLDPRFSAPPRALPPPRPHSAPSLLCALALWPQLSPSSFLDKSPLSPSPPKKCFERSH